MQALNSWQVITEPTGVQQQTVVLLDAHPATLTDVVLDSARQLPRPAWSYLVSGCLDFVRLVQEVRSRHDCALALRVAGPPPALSLISHGWDTLAQPLPQIAEGFRRISPRSVALGPQRLVIALDSTLTQVAQAAERKVVPAPTTMTAPPVGSAMLTTAKSDHRPRLFGSQAAIDDTVPTGHPTSSPRVVLVLIQKSTHETGFSYTEASDGDVHSAAATDLRALIQQVVQKFTPETKQRLQGLRLDIIKVALDQAWCHFQQDMVEVPVTQGITASVYHVTAPGFSAALAHLAHGYCRLTPVDLCLSNQQQSPIRVTIDNHLLHHDFTACLGASAPKMSISDPAVLRPIALAVVPDTQFAPPLEAVPFKCLHRLAVRSRTTGQASHTYLNQLPIDQPLFFTPSSAEIPETIPPRFGLFVLLRRAHDWLWGCIDGAQVPHLKALDQDHALWSVAGGEAPNPALHRAFVDTCVLPQRLSLHANSPTDQSPVWQTPVYVSLDANPVLMDSHQRALPTATIHLMDSEPATPFSMLSSALPYRLTRIAHVVPAWSPSDGLVRTRWWCKLYTLLLQRPDGLPAGLRAMAAMDPLATINYFLQGPLLCNLLELYAAFLPVSANDNGNPGAAASRPLDPPSAVSPKLSTRSSPDFDRLAVAVNRLVKLIQTNATTGMVNLEKLVAEFSKTTRSFSTASNLPTATHASDLQRQRTLLCAFVYRQVTRFLQWVTTAHHRISADHTEACGMIDSLISSAVQQLDASLLALVSPPSDTGTAGEPQQQPPTDVAQMAWQQANRYDAMTLREKEDMAAPSTTVPGLATSRVDTGNHFQSQPPASRSRSMSPSLKGQDLSVEAGSHRANKRSSTLSANHDPTEKNGPPSSQSPSGSRVQLKGYLRPRMTPLSTLQALQAKREQQLGPKSCLLYQYWSARPQQMSLEQTAPEPAATVAPAQRVQDAMVHQQQSQDRHRHDSSLSTSLGISGGTGDAMVTGSGSGGVGLSIGSGSLGASGTASTAPLLDAMLDPMMLGDLDFAPDRRPNKPPSNKRARYSTGASFTPPDSKRHAARGLDITSPGTIAAVSSTPQQQSGHSARSTGQSTSALFAHIQPDWSALNGKCQRDFAGRLNAYETPSQ
ncbi:hypothetical protein H4R34_001028 [Dimargaris verticillata]|uniref:Uncharacterized protein n=1 Tax=Dimargaris verticillata TaxID=2761393 RepID=A0A9W8EFD0_9FUNG|nr:hypothetical protein H4R34_001028 [Dimargaris verticillata]